jgi:dTDP-4-dehydrorhamnose reductase
VSFFVHKKILVFGENGQVAKALSFEMKQREIEHSAVFLSRNEADFMQPESCVDYIAKVRPDIVINAVAYTQVDKAETEVEAAMQINAHTPALLAAEAAKCGAIFVHYSTDYVFDGSGDAAFKEDDTTNPLSVYGRSKRLGEELVAAVGGKYLIFRTSWVYDAESRNFLTTMIRLACERTEISVVADQFGAPTNAWHIAFSTLDALDNAANMKDFPSGIYHMCNDGVTNWHQFAEQIFYEVQLRGGLEFKLQQCKAITSAEYPTPAKRPHNSRLDCSKLKNILGVEMLDWQVGLRDAVSAL